MLNPRPRRIPWKWLTLIGLLCYCGAAWGIVEKENRRCPGGMLHSYFREYAGGGSRKWRGREGNRFHRILLTWGLPAYAAAGAGILIGLLVAVRARRWSVRGAALLLCAGMLAVLIRFTVLGVGRAALEM